MLANYGVDFKIAMLLTRIPNITFGSEVNNNPNQS